MFGSVIYAVLIGGADAIQTTTCHGDMYSACLIAPTKRQLLHNSMDFYSDLSGRPEFQKQAVPHPPNQSVSYSTGVHCLVVFISVAPWKYFRSIIFPTILARRCVRYVEIHLLVGAPTFTPLCQIIANQALQSIGGIYSATGCDLQWSLAASTGAYHFLTRLFLHGPLVSSF
ncbi:hypothetical protein C8R47DRAFT_557976 [Mycena vitilis]|nr:hypothetical protein C8R47DRAFT_557976 [Mycena vitilis]